MNRRTFLSRCALSLFAGLIFSPLASAHETGRFEPLEGIRLGSIKYFAPATVRNEELEKALVKAFKISSGETVEYIYNRVSLTPGKEHIIALLPGEEYSGSGGSSAALFQVEASGYQLITRFSMFRPPVLVATTQTRGWSDLIVRTSGEGLPVQFSRLRFDGHGYPSNATAAPAFPQGSVIQGVAYLATSPGTDGALSFVAP